MIKQLLSRKILFFRCSLIRAFFRPKSHGFAQFFKIVSAVFVIFRKKITFFSCTITILDHTLYGKVNSIFRQDRVFRWVLGLDSWRAAALLTSNQTYLIRSLITLIMLIYDWNNNWYPIVLNGICCIKFGPNTSQYLFILLMIRLREIKKKKHLIQAWIEKELLRSWLEVRKEIYLLFF